MKIILPSTKPIESQEMIKVTVLMIITCTLKRTIRYGVGVIFSSRLFLEKHKRK